jgi:hypothetical protein
VEESQVGQEAVSPLFWKECDMRRRSEVLVTEFLRDALAVDALGVPELEARARAIGLLGERQSITHIRVFKRAKKSLGIRSLRAGFGARSQWRWQLPRQSDGSLKTDSGTARERRGPIPIDWVQGVAYLDPDRPPNDVPRHRWRQFVCKNFLSSPEKWAERAAGLGWDAMALFGCAPKRPLDHFGSAGLLWAIKGGRLIELHRCRYPVSSCECRRRLHFDDRKRCENRDCRVRPMCDRVMLRKAVEGSMRTNQ